MQQFALVALACGVLALQARADTRELDWDDLLPPGGEVAGQSEDSLAVIRGDSLADSSPAGPVNAGLDGQQIRIPGFLVPLESDEGGLLSEFFLVPYFGACIHVPPPPPNQMIYVKLDKPFDLQTLWTPFWIEGEMSTRAKSSAMGTAGYSVKASAIEEYEW